MFNMFRVPLVVETISNDAARAESRAETLEVRVRALEAHLIKAMIINETLWEIMKEKLNLTDGFLEDQVSKVDLRESTSKECPKCHHIIAPRHPVCIYCGQLIDSSIFT
jgi:hypothetical protein